MESSSGKDCASPMPYTALMSSEDHSAVFDEAGVETDDQLQQFSESDMLLEAASELLQFVNNLDGLLIKTDVLEQGKSIDEPISPPSHILDHNYASASPNPNAKRPNQNTHDRRSETYKRVSSYGHGRHRNGAVF